MKKLIVVGFIAVALAGCASTEYRAYEGKEEIVQGVGGTKDVTDGVEFWMTGTPPHKYKIIGVASGAIGSGYGADGIIQSSIAGKVKELGGSAAVLITGNTSGPTVGMVYGNAVMIGGGVRELQFAIVKYLD